MQEPNLYNSPKVANKIKETAKQKRKTLKDLLKYCNLGSNTFSHMLHGKSIAYSSLANIADYLECSVDYLLDRKGINSITSEEENRLIEAYRQLTDEGQRAVLNFAEMSAQSPQYQKYTDIPKEA